MSRTPVPDNGGDSIKSPAQTGTRREILEGIALWLSGKSENTRESYQQALNKFVTYLDAPFEHTTPADVVAWKEHLKKNLEDSTVHQRLSAISSCFSKLESLEIVSDNPVRKVERNDLDTSPYGNAKRLDPESFRSILVELNTDTPAGARNFALFLFYAVCARRRSEVLDLQRQDLDLGDPIMASFRLKGGDTAYKEIPPGVFSAFTNYLETDERALDTLQSDEYLFCPTEQSLQHEQSRSSVPENVRAEHDENERKRGHHRLSGSAVLKALKRTARRAGVDPDRVSVHALRHLGAQLYRAEADDITELKGHLDHERLDTTQVYVEALEGDAHKYASSIMQSIGVNPNTGSLREDSS